MSPCEKFELLCALAATGQLDPQEKRDLDVHIQGCAACEAVLLEFQEVSSDLSAQVAKPGVVLSLEEESQKASRFATFARTHGLRFSNDASRVLQRGKSSLLKFAPFAYVTALTLVCMTMSVMWFSQLHEQIHENVLTAQLSLPKPSPPAEPAISVDSNTERIAQLQSELDAALLRAGQVAALQQKLGEEAKENDDLKMTVADRDAALVHLQTNASDIQKQLLASQATMASLHNENDRMIAELSSEHVHSALLEENLRDEKTAAERDRELSAASQEVRSLMGARQLFMVDVYDGESSSRSARSFGRVFYTEGQSLIFYAFDLDRVHNAKRVSFEAWGVAGRNTGPVKHLGDFYVDDVNQKRWVMKVNDPEKLKAIDSVFVTVEPSKGVNKPTGQKLLYAYLGGQPNHP